MTKATKDRLNRVRSILVSQPKPTDERSPYFQLAEKYNLKIDFRPFIQVEPVSVKDFRKQKIDILKHTAIIFTSRNAIDHFFNICQEFTIEMPADMKYFCISEQTTHYLQKYIVMRKWKLSVRVQSDSDLFDYFEKRISEEYLFPGSDIRKDDTPEFLSKKGIEVAEAIMYHTVAADLSDLKDMKYDILASFSSSGIRSL